MSEKVAEPLLEGVVRYTVSVEVLTGLRIGGYSDVSRIGGVDLIVAKTPQYVDGVYETLPYVPGSSLKGKLRSLLELKDGHLDENGGTGSNNCDDADCPICMLFGRRPTDKLEEKGVVTLSRLVFRDLYPTEDTIKMWRELEERGVLYEGVEVKSENTLNRYTASANPRHIERVPKGSVFEGELVLRLFKGDDKEKLMGKLREAIDLLNKDYLGGHGTRGYGRVRVTIEPVDSE